MIKNIVSGIVYTSVILLVFFSYGDCQTTEEALGLSLSDFMNNIQFKNSGTVNRDMQFIKVPRKSLYLETDELYSTINTGKESNRRYSKTYNYLFLSKGGDQLEPPSGMRSAVPLGGLGAGSVELRADGRFVDWNIFNNSPAITNEKVQLNDALMGLWVGGGTQETTSTTLRTHPPSGLPAVKQIEYSGAFPVSRLKFTDPKIKIQSTLYAYSEFQIRQPDRSGAPCILMSIELHNPTDQPVNAAFLFNLPNHIDGKFSLENGLVLSKPGNEPSNGNMTLHATGADHISYYVGNNIKDLWGKFSEKGQFEEVNYNKEGAYGAISAKSKITPGETKTITIGMGWYFPNLPISVEVVGNYYTNLFSNSSDVLNHAFETLPDLWAGIAEWNRTCFDNTLPGWLQDAMVNSIATMVKTGIWTKDGRFRQWESFACPNIDPIHIHFARSLPYELFFPEFKQSIIGAHGAAQRENGYIPEKLWPRNSQCALDKPTPGRILGDCSTSFILSVYMTHKWTGDKQFVDQMWPKVKGAVEWQMDRAKRLGLPDRLASTYDLSNFGEKDLVSYNAFMHIAALKAAIELAKAYEEHDLVSSIDESLEIAQGALRKYLWTGQYFRNWWSQDKAANDDIHIDTQYGQLWSYLLGLGNTIDEKFMLDHLEMEEKMGNTPYGLKVFSNFQEEENDKRSHVDKTIWQAGSINWSILNLYLGTSVEKSLAQAKNMITHWNKRINDQWNYSDLTNASDGYPHTNSHYGRQLTLWGLPIALSGQNYSAPEKRLAFSPKVDGAYRLPFYIPSANGVLVSEPGKSSSIMLISGEMNLKELVIDGRIVARNVSMKAGERKELIK